MSFTHARRIAGYNRRLYVAAVVGIGIGASLILSAAGPPLLTLAAGAAIAAAVWLSLSSFGAFHWMFDRSELLEGRWLHALVGAPPARWIQINAGLEETTLPLRQIFPDAEGRALDIYSPETMTEPAITRARQRAGSDAAIVARPEALPVENDWGDLVVVMLAAHEIRDRARRERFFGELTRIVSPEGRIVLVEHLRDLAAAVAFGPGFFHFLPHREWTRLIAMSGLKLERERAITPFVRVFVIRRAWMAEPKTA